MNPIFVCEADLLLVEVEANSGGWFLKKEAFLGAKKI